MFGEVNTKKNTGRKYHSKVDNKLKPMKDSSIIGV